MNDQFHHSLMMSIYYYHTSERHKSGDKKEMKTISKLRIWMRTLFVLGTQTNICYWKPTEYKHGSCTHYPVCLRILLTLYPVNMLNIEDK